MTGLHSIGTSAAVPSMPAGAPVAQFGQMSDPVSTQALREAAFARMSKSFPVNRGLSSEFLLLANAHPHAIDYIEQAPVIIAAAPPPRPAHRGGWSFVREELGTMCEHGAKLRDVMRAFCLPLPLRMLQARALTRNRETVIWRLALINPSTLAQIIPASFKEQNAWLAALEQWCASMAAKSDRRCLFFEWAAIRYSGIKYGETRGVSHMVDFVCAHANTFNPRWTLDRARAEESSWHEELARNEPVESSNNSDVQEVDYAPLPLRWEHGDLSFVALQTQKALHAEGAAMSHCVASYWWNVVRGGSRIYSIMKDGRRVATVELTTGCERYRWGKTNYRVRQISGFRNARATPEVAKAVGLFLEEIQGLH